MIHGVEHIHYRWRLRCAKHSGQPTITNGGYHQSPETRRYSHLLETLQRQKKKRYGLDCYFSNAASMKNVRARSFVFSGTGLLERYESVIEVKERGWRGCFSYDAFLAERRQNW